MNPPEATALEIALMNLKEQNRRGDLTKDFFNSLKLDVADALLEELGFSTEVYQKIESGNLNLGFVYLAENGRNGCFKIGFSGRPKIRERTLQSEEPEVRFVGIWRGSRVDEKVLHQKFSNFRVRGEWFRIPYELIPEVEGYFKNNRSFLDKK